MSNTTYEDYKLQQLHSATTIRVFGHPLEGLRMSGNSASKWVVLRPCFCVQDTPENPCSCPERVIWWVLASDIQSSGRANKKTHDGEELNYYDVNTTSQAIVESTKSVSIKSLSEKRKISPKDLVKLAKIIASIKSRRNNAGSGANDKQPEVTNVKDILDDLNDFFDWLHEWVNAGESSGADLGEVLEVVGGLILLL